MNIQFRQVASFIIVATFVVVLLGLGIRDEAKSVATILTDSLEDSRTSSKRPNFPQYIQMTSLSSEDLALERPGRRIIIIGDVHGMNNSMHDILSKLHYDSSRDLLIHVGDILAKGTLEGSLAVLSYMTSNNVTGVRGNHDQKVIEWRAWLEQVLAHKGGQAWLEEMERKSQDELKIYAKKGKGKGWKKIPKGWKMLEDHYMIAKSMYPDQYKYLISLPLVIHAPSLHSFIVHAGMLPLDPHRSISNSRQPLSHIPSLSDKLKAPNITALREAQELSLLSEVPQNLDPWVLLNIRGVLNNNEVTRSTSDGNPWSDLWTTVLDRCRGFDGALTLEDVEDASSNLKPKLPCHPSTIVYGHAAARGLDIKRWSMGLDTGCVYQRKLTALIIGPENSGDGSLETQSIKFGESRKARVVSIKC
ncbi:Metallo-dependent phosphatase [Rickenella mellea]|uniref:Metallo-dependent phosphatase n=1 Tax=Rickenella mellea TaxID=50990 RepID=A0A4Y7QF88_9AGAM|nr:Metallo-dependent phosphatase [Rickenella mellea]